MDATNDRDMYRTLDAISELAWESHRAWEKIIGEHQSESSWDDLEDIDRGYVKDSVAWLINNPSSSVSAQHDAWRARKVLEWDEHPNLVPFDELPLPQQVKARLWRHVILAVIG